MAYNGWSNWETWNVALWLSNKRAYYHYYIALIGDCDDVGEFETKLRVFEKNMQTDLDDDDWNDVDWQEIAENLWEEYEEDE